MPMNITLKKLLQKSLFHNKKGFVSLLFFYISQFVLISSCSGPISGIRTVSPEILHKRSFAAVNKVRSLRGSGYMIVESPEHNFRANFRVWAGYPDSIRIKIDGTLGIDVFDLFISGKKILAYFPNDNKFYSEAYSDELLESLIYISTSFQEILEVTRGIITLPEEVMNNLNFRNNSGNAVSRKYKNNYSESWFYEPGGRYIKEYKKFDPDSNLVVNKSLLGFQKEKGVFFPKSIYYRYPLEKMSIRMVYRYRKINDELGPDHFKVKIPVNAERVKDSP